ncbi:MAG: 6-carboxytetrahydropterin synthase, partial [Candidatus Aminicenantes bacterium]|nr:6-carboxytetrahydropterin synthase [Candidatus Aminicenantes bacterium]
MYRITKRFTIAAAHKLPWGLEHPCSRLHGHNYWIEIELEGELNEQGCVMDYQALRDFKTLLRKYDHEYLNDFLR